MVMRMYKSPIDVIYEQMQTKMEGDILRAVQGYGINVDKDELVRALKYDREQYKKGYADGHRDAKEELVRCKDCRNSMLWRKPTDKVIGECFIRKMNSDDEQFCMVGADDFCSYGERRADHAE